MKYVITLKHYRDFKVFEENKLPPRAYFIPYPSEPECAAATRLTRRYGSKKVRLLNGTWDFAYFPCGAKMPAEIDTDEMRFDAIPVPSCWQNLGYEPPFYVNIRYPFPPEPPRVPVRESVGTYGKDVNGAEYVTGKRQHNSAGVYRTFFDARREGKSYILSFLGVAGCLALYCNGRYVGYSEGSHNTAEFCLDDYLVDGKNELVAVVRKWCTGSYLEDQDMFRYNGIFRDVLLFVNESTHVFDLAFTSSRRAAGQYDATLQLTIRRPAGAKVTATLTDDARLIAYQTASAEETTLLQFPGLEVEQWSAEQPRLYTLTVTLYQGGEVKEVIKKLVGFRTVQVRGNVYYLNDQPIKLMGVNHHDSSPKTGYYMTPEEWERDVQLMKAYNINCVRTSHYPPDPLFLELADLYGLYVIDEADIEAHGTKNRNQISHDGKWKPYFWDRVRRMFGRDRNAPSVVMWSLGNEAGGYRCQDFCYDNLKKLTDTPIHYERACATHRGAYDVAGWMYMDVPGLEKIGNGSWRGWPAVTKAFRTKPFLLTEYAHTMGVGPGNLTEYWQVIDRYDNLLGGCVWEFADHAVWHETGKYRYTYGGDHGEYVHDGNFCVDGMFYPDRTPSTSALAVQHAYRPLTARMQGKLLIVTNRNYFRNAEYLTIRGEICSEGVAVSTFTLDSNIPPRAEQKFNLLLEDFDSDAYVTLTYYEGERVIAKEQLPIKEQLTRLKLKEFDAEKVGRRVTVREFGDMLRVGFHNGFVTFSKTTGGLLNYAVGDAEFVGGQPLRTREGEVLSTALWRAPMDNDMYLKGDWQDAGYDDLKKRDVRVVASLLESRGPDQPPTVMSPEKRQAEEALVECKYKLGSKRGDLFAVTDSFRVNGMGIITLKSIVTPLKKGLPDLPLVGKWLEVNKQFDDILFYGRGDVECYPDFEDHACMGVYRMQAGAFAGPYIRPQESGNRTDVRYAALRNRKGEGFLILANVDALQLNAATVLPRDVAAAAHQEDLKPVEDRIYVRVCSHVAGVGSNSCGPLTLPQYRLSANASYETNFRLVPFSAIGDDVVVWENPEA